MRGVYGFLIMLFLHQVCYAQQFTDVTQSAGIFMVPIHQNLMGGGVTWFDYNNDGHADVYYTGCRIRDVLYRNNGDGTFTDVTMEAGLMFTDSFDTMGVVHGDFNNDGNEDLFISVRKNISTNELGRNILYKNNGDGTFTDVTISSGLTEEVWSTSAALLDVNLDGFLDIYVLNYLEETGFILDENGITIGFDHQCFENSFYLNNGNFTFTEQAENYGINSLGCGLALSVSDVDKDGDPDIQIANDFGEFVIPDQLYLNNYPDPTFTEVGLLSGFNTGHYGMGVAVGDIDNDLDQDFYLTNMGRNSLLLNESDGMEFTDITEESGTSNFGNGELLFTSWGDMFLDVDHDTYLDLFVANGHMTSANFLSNVIDDPDRLYVNNGDLTFTDLSGQSGLDFRGICRGAAYGDFDKDGFLDITVSAIQNPFLNYEGVRLYRNENEEGNWVIFTLEGTEANRNAYGSSVTLYSGENSFYRELLGGSSHLSQNQSILHFGLGNLTEIDSVVVNWIGGTFNTFSDLELNQYHHLVQETENSTHELQVLSEVQFFPNPVKKGGMLFFDFPEAGNLEFIDPLGKEISQIPIIKGRNEIHVHLGSGIYIASMKTENYTWFTKLYISE